jgi:hypothetical protein
VCHFLFVNAPQLQAHVGHSPTRVFLIILGLFCQVFGGGISGEAQWYTAQLFSTAASCQRPAAVPVVPCYNEQHVVRPLLQAI